MKRKVVVVNYKRTPFGKLGGILKEFGADDLGGLAIKELIKTSYLDSKEIDYVYLGQVLQGGCGQIPSRQATVKAGLPWEVPSILINKVCSSGMVAIENAKMRIESGKSDIVIAGGMESMSSAPYFLDRMRWGNRMGDSDVKDLMIHDGLWCPFYDRHMAVHGSEVSKEYGISRRAQDEWAVISQERAVNAIDNKSLRNEVIEIETKAGIVNIDEGPRRGTTPEALSELSPVFDAMGTVTAGNAPGVNDGAAALLLMEENTALELGQEILAEVIDFAEVSQEAKYIATVPGLSINKLLEQNNIKVEDIDLFEVNEAFAAVVLVSQKIANYNLEKVNIHGGAIAYGHPIGASGARIVMHLIEALRNKGGGYGVAAICSGAAQGDALLLKVY